MLSNYRKFEFGKCSPALSSDYLLGIHNLHNLNDKLKYDQHRPFQNNLDIAADQ